MRNTIPPSLQGIFWSKSVDTLDVKRDNIYIIHQVLSVGDMDAIRWLFATYTKDEIARVFSESPKKVYPKATFYYVRDVLLGLDNRSLSPIHYVKQSPGNSFS